MVNGLFAAVMLTSIVACGFTTIGIGLIRTYEPWARRYAVYFMSFAAGVLLSVSFVHIIPESFWMSPAGPMFLLIGFMALYLTNRFLDTYLPHEHESSGHAIGIVPVLGIGFHSFVDGIIYAVTFNVSIFTGVLAAIGMILHEVPEGIVTFVLLERGGFDRRKSALYAFLAAALTTPLGTLVSYPFIHTISQPALGALLAISGGALVYVGASHLLPAVEREGGRFSVLALAAGVLVALVIIRS